MGDFTNVSLIFLGIGGLSILIGLFFLFRTRRFLSGAVSVQGTVLDMIARSGSEGGTVYSPVVQFTTQEGQEMTFTESVASYPPRHAAGDVVKVMYTPGDPGSARIPSWFRLWFIPVFGILFGAAFLGAGFFVRATVPDTTEVPGVGGLPVPAEVASLIPEINEELPAAGDPVIVFQQGGAPSRISPATCDALREVRGGKGREVRLSFEGGTLTFRASPYTGPGPYTPGTNVQVGGSAFPDPSGITGAVIFNDDERSGVVNLVAGDTIVNGSWACGAAG